MTSKVKKQSLGAHAMEVAAENKFATLVTSLLMLVMVFFGPQFNSLKAKLGQTENLIRVVNEVLVDNALNAEEVVKLQDALKAFNPPAPTPTN